MDINDGIEKKVEQIITSFDFGRVKTSKEFDTPYESPSIEELKKDARICLYTAIKGALDSEERIGIGEISGFVAIFIKNMLCLYYTINKYTVYLTE